MRYSKLVVLVAFLVGLSVDASAEFFVPKDLRHQIIERADGTLWLKFNFPPGLKKSPVSGIEFPISRTVNMSTKLADLNAPMDIVARMEWLRVESRYAELVNEVLGDTRAKSAKLYFDWFLSNIFAGRISSMGMAAYSGLFKRMKRNEEEALWGFYAYLVSYADSLRCADKSAKGAAARHFKPLLAAFSALPNSRKRHLMHIAMTVEQRTRPVRIPDQLLCRHGLKYITKALQTSPSSSTQRHCGQAGTLGCEAIIPDGGHVEIDFVRSETWTESVRKLIAGIANSNNIPLVNGEVSISHPPK